MPETNDRRTANIDDLMRQIEAFGVGTPDYHEAMWMLLSVMARRQAIIADRLRADQRRRDRAAETRTENLRRKQALEEFHRSELIGEGGTP